MFGNLKAILRIFSRPILFLLPRGGLNIEIFCVGLSLIKIFRIAVRDALGHLLTWYWNLITVIRH